MLNPAIKRHTRCEVDTTSKRLTVANEPIEGGMGAMTMTYAVDNAEVLSRLKVGDRITAKMYDGDSTLYEVKIVAPPGAPQLSDKGDHGMRLEDLEQMALANNPTMAQVQANLRMAAGLSRAPPALLPSGVRTSPPFCQIQGIQPGIQFRA